VEEEASLAFPRPERGARTPNAGAGFAKLRWVAAAMKGRRGLVRVFPNTGGVQQHAWNHAESSWAGGCFFSRTDGRRSRVRTANAGEEWGRCGIEDESKGLA